MDANRALAIHIADAGRLPLLELFSWVGGALPADGSSTPVVAHLEQAIRFDRSVGVPDGPVLLCATTMRTGWTITMAATILHEIGGATSLPLVIHRLP
jgi:ATP-dependent DNA helicase RecQ